MTCTVEHQFSCNIQSIITKVTLQEADSKISAGKTAVIFSIPFMPNGGKGRNCNGEFVFWLQSWPGCFLKLWSWTKIQS